MVEQRIQQQFYESADLQVQWAERLAKPIGDAAAAMLGAITAGGKVLGYGGGASYFDAQRFIAALIGKFERDRPALAALSLAGEANVMHAMASGHEYTLVAAKQLQALGAPGDVLLVVTADTPTAALSALVDIAHDKDLAVVALTGRQAETFARGLSETDVHVSAAHERLARVQEIHGLALNCLCDAIDLQLMGDEELG